MANHMLPLQINLVYVAVTRTKQRLFVNCSLYAYLHEGSAIHRELSELQGRVSRAFQAKHPCDADLPPARKRARLQASVPSPAWQLPGVEFGSPAGTSIEGATRI